MLPNFQKISQIKNVIKWQQCYCSGGHTEWLIFTMPSCGQGPHPGPSKLSAPPPPKSCLFPLNKETLGLLQLARARRVLPYTTDTSRTMPPTPYICLAPYPNSSNSGGSHLVPVTGSLCILKNGMPQIKKDLKDMQVQCDILEDPGLDKLAIEDIWGTTGTICLSTGQQSTLEDYFIRCNHDNLAI